MKNEMHPYQFSRFELDLMERLAVKFTKYENFGFNRWPKIYWGNDLKYDNTAGDNQPSQLMKNYDPHFQIDLLGAYIHRGEGEGIIELYENRIYDSAERISKNLGMEFEKTFDWLRAIVLLHELGHWFAHWCIMERPYLLRLNYKILSEDKFITETMAQLSVIWACIGLTNSRIKNLLSIMDFLADRQPAPYYQYKKMGKNQSKIATIQKRYLKLLDLSNIDLEYLLFQTNIPAADKSVNMFKDLFRP
ncbi:MAG: hypothetical protein ACK5CL_08855 [Sphingomonadales bacterium]|jgi:hypothetical protein